MRDGRGAIGTGLGRAGLARMAAVLLVAASASALSGCAFGVSIASAEQKGVTPAAEPLPIRAIYRPSGKVKYLSTTFAGRLKATNLFQDVVDRVQGEDATLTAGDVIVSYAPTEIHDYKTAPLRATLTGIGFAVFVVPGLIMLPFDLIPLPQPSIEIPYTLEVRAVDGEILYECSTKQEVAVSAMAFASDTEVLAAGRKLADDNAEKVLLSRLATDPNVPEQLKKAKGRRPPADPDAQPGPTPTAPGPIVVEGPPGPPLPTGGRTFVLIVGVNRYDDEQIPSLRFAESDARAVYGYYTTDSRSPTDADRVQLYLGRDATRQNILRGLREHLIQKAVKKEDTAVLYFAGHGFTDTTDTYLAAVDTELSSLPETSISLNSLERYWKQIACGRKVLITDACHSGGLAGLRGGGTTRTEGFGTTLAIAATGPNELSVEDEKLGHGVFTMVLLNGMRGDADLDKDGTVTAHELSQYLAESVPVQAKKLGANQQPQIALPQPLAGLRISK